MRYWHDVINCKAHYANTKRDRAFWIIGYRFDYTNTEDKRHLDDLLAKAEDLSHKVNVGAANDAITNRSKNRLLANCIAGVVSEYCWMHFLNYKQKCVQPTPFVSASNQIDLEIVNNKKRIEVRSSFPRNGINFAICDPKNEFDVIGPYSNAYKPGEVNKDYYVRTLFHLSHPEEILERIKSNHFELYLTGGATFGMMIDTRYSFDKDFVPEDSFIIQKTKYRVVPFHNALDCKQIYGMIINEK